MGSTYEQDWVLWSEEQARVLRAAANTGWNAPIDWENVAEEIESFGRSDRRSLGCHIAIVIEHLRKFQACLSTMPARGWTESVFWARGAIELLHAESSSLRSEIAGMITNGFPRARALLRASCREYREQPLIDLDQVTYSEDQGLGEWMPDQA